MTIAPAENIVDVLRSWAARRPDHTALTFLEDGEVPTETLTYAALDRRAREVAAGLRPLVNAGDRVLLLHPPGLDFVTAFFGCLYQGAVPVPAYPPRNARHFPRIEAILADADASCVLTHTELRDRLTTWLRQRGAALSVVCSDTLSADPDAWQRSAAATADTLAFLQYTSGSTGDPKGVMVTHGNLVTNQHMIRHAFAHGEGLVTVSWLPIYHDMGLIGSLMQPLFLGGHCVLMAPAAFLQKPRRWLAAISSYRAQSSGGPNFAFKLCTATVTDDQKAGLDLSSLQVFFSGSEPINAAVLDQFADAFAPAGFRREALRTCYGMAESTLIATASAPGPGPVVETVDAVALAMNLAMPPAPDAPSRVVVGCGVAVQGQELSIVAAEPDTAADGSQPSGRVLADGRVGEIWLRGANIAAGYWRKPELTRERFGARVAEAESNDHRPFLRTGDLGFVRNGELFVTGRIKDLVIIRGRNHYPHDLELTAHHSHDALRSDSGAAFPVDMDGEERLVVVFEIGRHHHGDAVEAAARVRAAIAEEHDILPYAVVLVRQGSVPKTSSGKIKRSACAQAFAEARLHVVHEWREAPALADGEDVIDPRVRAGVLAAPPEDRVRLLEERLRHHLSTVLRVPAAAIDAEQPLVTLGMDSLTAVDLKNRVETETGVALSLLQLVDGSNLAELARVLVASMTNDSRPVPADSAARSAPEPGSAPSFLTSLLSPKR